MYLDFSENSKLIHLKSYILPSKNDNYDIFIDLLYFLCLKQHEFIIGIEKKETKLTIDNLFFPQILKHLKRYRIKNFLLGEKKKNHSMFR